MTAARLCEIIAPLTRAERRVFIAAMTQEEVRAAQDNWAEWANKGQYVDLGEGRTGLVMAGRGYGKTRAGSEWIVEQVRDAEAPLRIALVGATLPEARRLMVEGESGLLNVCDGDIAAWVPSRGLLRFRGGSQAELFSGASPDALRGFQHHLAWCDEIAKWPRGLEAWDMLQMGLRLGDRPQVLVTTTPRACEVLRRIQALPHVGMGGATRENIHLPPAFIAAMTAMYEGTRLGRQELEGELLPDVQGALWSVELLEGCRLLPDLHGARGFARIVIGVDPPAGGGTCGIVACGVDRGGVGHVLGDHSVSGRSAEGWARAVAAAVEAHGAHFVVAEGNQGGAMVEAVLRSAGVDVRVKTVHASIGKSARADPIATLCEAGRVRFAGRFPALEAELCGLIGGGGYEGPGASPDRADAMVWALTELMLGPRERRVGVRVV